VLNRRTTEKKEGETVDRRDAGHGFGYLTITEKRGVARNIGNTAKGNKGEHDEPVAQA